MVRLYIEFLRGEGIEASQASSGPEALALLEKTPTPDLIFVDSVMPGMNGEEFARELAERLPQVRSATVVVGMSGLDFQSSQSIAFKKVVDALECKPASFDALCSILKKYLPSSP